MSLAGFFQQIGPFLEGRQGHQETAAALYGSPPAPGFERDARRLRIYGRFCRVHRFEVIESVWTETRAQLERLLGAAAWESLVEEHFRAHPMHHVELTANGDGWVDLLSARAAQGLLPGWVAELADLEWTEFRTGVAPDDAADEPTAPGSPLRLASTVDLRPYQHQLVEWLDHQTGGPRPSAPEPGAAFVLFWRDLDLDARREDASPLELLVLRAVMQGQDPSAEGAPSAPVDHAQVAEVVGDLRAAGVLLGGG